jgi:NADP-dependent 3-hydroxy acid dehydrogenase YdfG
MGASGKLGGALARKYARPGTRLSLWGRDEARLAAIAAVCRAAGAIVEIRSLDIEDVHAAVAAVLAEDIADPFDLALLVSGLGDIRPAGDQVEPVELVMRLGTVNFTAPAAIGAAISGRMALRGYGAVVFVGSATAFRALPFAAAYSGTKQNRSAKGASLNKGSIWGRDKRVTDLLWSPRFDVWRHRAKLQMGCPAFVLGLLLCGHSLLIDPIVRPNAERRIVAAIILYRKALRFVLSSRK